MLNKYFRHCFKLLIVLVAVCPVMSIYRSRLLSQCHNSGSWRSHCLIAQLSSNSKLEKKKKSNLRCYNPCKIQIQRGFEHCLLALCPISIWKKRLGRSGGMPIMPRPSSSLLTLAQLNEHLTGWMAIAQEWFGRWICIHIAIYNDPDIRSTWVCPPF